MHTPHCINPAHLHHLASIGSLAALGCCAAEATAHALILLIEWREAQGAGKEIKWLEGCSMRIPTHMAEFG